MASAVVSVSLFIFVLFVIRIVMIYAFKIGYYEQKLKNRGIDVSHIENITLREIFRTPKK